MILRLRDCEKCSMGAMELDRDGDWACWNCGHVRYQREPLLFQPPRQANYLPHRSKVRYWDDEDD